MVTFKEFEFPFAFAIGPRHKELSLTTDKHNMSQRDVIIVIEVPLQTLDCL